MRGWVSIAILVTAFGIAAFGVAAAQADKRPPPSPPADSKGVGYLVVYSTPWARIHIDGKDTGKTTPITPRTRFELAPGKHKLTFVVGTDFFHYTITIKAGETLKITKQLPVAE